MLQLLPDMPQLDSTFALQVYTLRFNNCSLFDYLPILLDSHGKVRIWDTVNAEHILKNEYHMMSGPIVDMAWNDKDKIAVCGQGKEKYISYLCIFAID